MKKIMRTCIAALLAFALMPGAALAEETVISDREKAILLSDRAMEEKYGITLLTQEYFVRTTEEKSGGIWITKYEGMASWAYVLGTYKVTVENGAVTGISWSHDGEETSGGLNAEAWGRDQILEMLRLNQKTGDTSLFDARVDEINRKYGLVFGEYLSDEEQEEMELLEAEEADEARKQAALSAKELNEIAKQAVKTVYQLTDEQAGKLEDLIGVEDGGSWYAMFHGIPCMVACFALGDGETEAEMQPNGIRYNEKEGTYWIYVNVQTGVAEELLYSAGIGGNG